MSAITPNTPEGLLTGGSTEGAVLPPTIALVRHIISFLKWRFSLLPAGSYRWLPDTENEPDQGGSEVFLSSDTPIKSSHVGVRPAITVLRSTAAFQGVGIGDMAYVDLRTGTQARMDLIPTNIVINVVSREPLEAEALAWFVAEQLFTFREEIVQALPSLLYTGARPSLSAVSPAGALIDSTETEWCAVVVAMPAFLQHSTTKMPINKKPISGVTVNATAQRPDQPVPPPVILQGTSINQPLAGSVVTGSGALPQTGSADAQSSEPLTVKIQT